MRIIVITISFLFGMFAVADSWVPAHSIAAVSENAEWLVRVEPGDSMGDVYGFAGTPKGNYAAATLFKYDNDLETYAEVKIFRTRNPIAPVDVVLSNNGWIVALDNWHNFGIGTVVASYDSDGALVRELKLADIFTQEDLGKLDRSVSSVWWRCGPAELDNFTTTIGIRDTLGREISINYVDGTINVVGESGDCVD